MAEGPRTLWTDAVTEAEMEIEALLLAKKVREKLATRMGGYQPSEGSAASSPEGWYAFEYADQPLVKYDFAPVGKCELLNALAEISAVAAFLFLLAGREVGAFEPSSWDQPSRPYLKVVGHAYLVVMMLVSTYFAYLALAGTLLEMVNKRITSKMGAWEHLCEAAVEPITEAIRSPSGKGLAGKRQLCYAEALNAVVASNTEYSRILQVCLGAAKFAPEDVRCTWAPETGSWLIHFHSPQYVTTRMAFRLVGSPLLPLCGAAFVAAKACMGFSSPDRPVAAIAACIAAFWLGRLVWGARLAIAKLRD